MENGNVVVKKSCHCRGMLSAISRIRLLKQAGCFCLITTVQKEDSRQKPSGMTPSFNNGAFTLIELLVVVLIIGILAAVAVPQYQRAVYKARAAEAVIILKALVQAEEAYFLANGMYTNSIENLDISIQKAKNTLFLVLSKDI